MNFLSQFSNARAEIKRLTEQSIKLADFCNNDVGVVQEGTTQQHINIMRKADKNSSNSHLPTVTPLHDELAKEGGVITAPYSSHLIAFLASIYANKTFHFYLIVEHEESLPYLQQLIQLQRITAIKHQDALTNKGVSINKSPIYISIPEFHPKSLSSGHSINIHGNECIFSTYTWLLKVKRNIPLYLLTNEKQLVSAKSPGETYKSLALSYQSLTTNIYSWSRLHSHKVEQLEQRFISQANQLEALLRYIRPSLECINLQPTLDTIKHQKTNSLARSPL